MSEHKIQWIKDRSYLCVAPFNNYDYRILEEKLKITVCCNLDTKFTNNEVDNNFIESLKTDINNKKLPTACYLCSTVEQEGAQSERIKYLSNFNQTELEQFEQDKKTPDFQVGMKFSNRCNLACRSCNSFDSSFWAEKMNKPSEVGVDIDISDNPEYWKAITNTIRQKHNETGYFILHPIGGETMLQAGFIKLIDWMIAEGLASTTSIRITTSLIVNLEDMRDRLLKFKHIHFLASVDSINENYHYVRWPGKFNKVLTNLSEFLYVRAHYPGKYDLLITPVFSLNNIFYALDWLDFWHNWCNENNVDIYLQTTHINRPAPIMVESLPDRYRPYLIEILTQVIDHPVFKQYSTTQVQHEYFISMLDLMQSPAPQAEQCFIDYLKFSADYDKRTGTDSFVLNSRLYRLLTLADRQIYRNHYDNVDTTQPVYDIAFGLADINDTKRASET